MRNTVIGEIWFSACSFLQDPKPKTVKQILKPKDQEDFETWIAGIKQKRQEKVV
jgi:hypothetical protein